ncbi:MAG TPA: DeoR/GlpR family DNA-binding transcription regulator [Anaerolineales bacterium]|nr:DeoR/GlpR family DNA-binding transcription regulator [Anaerolineales bacterium]
MLTNEALLKAERHNHIRKLVEQKGRVMVAELSLLFEVSEATIRRDLEDLDGQGWIQRTHGGAVRVERATKEPPMLLRTTEQLAEKQRIGQAAAGLVKDGETIFLGSGTTVLEIARHLPKDLNLTVITNSLPVVNELTDRPNVELIVIGGLLRHSELSMVGHIAEQAIREFRADQAFMGMRAIDARHGFTNDYLPETMTDRAILSLAPRIIVLADHRKFGRVSSVLVGPVTVAHMVITDKATSEECIVELRELGIEVLQV